MTTPTSVFSQDHLDRIYPAGIERFWWNRARNAIVARLLERHGGRDGRVLEIGCGTGVVVGALADRGFEVMGCDLARGEPAESAHGRVRLGCDAFELAADERGAVRTVLLLDVLEHLDDPAGFLGRVRERFEGAVRVLVTLPACPSLWTNYDEHYGHKLRYDAASLRALAERARAGIVESGYFFHGLWVPAWIMARLGMRRSIEVTPPSGIGAQAHGIVARFFEVEQRVVPGWVAGSSLYGVLELAGEGGA